MMQKILAERAAPLLAGIQSQLSEESQVIQSEEPPPAGKSGHKRDFLCCCWFRRKEKRSFAVFGVIKRHFVNNPTGLYTMTVLLKTAGNLKRRLNTLRTYLALFLHLDGIRTNLIRDAWKHNFEPMTYGWQSVTGNTCYLCLQSQRLLNLGKYGAFSHASHW